jgi:hypothetical protein
VPSDTGEGHLAVSDGEVRTPGHTFEVIAGSIAAESDLGIGIDTDAGCGFTRTGSCAGERGLPARSYVPGQEYSAEPGAQ